MRKTATQKKSVELWKQEQIEAKHQEESRLKLYGICKDLRDVGPTGDESLDALKKELKPLCGKIRDRLYELS